MSAHKVLIAEDNEAVRCAVAEFLSSCGYEVHQAGGVEDCYKKFQMVDPDAVLLDYSLPDGNALDLLPRLKALRPSASVIVLTGYGTISLAVRAIKEGAEQFITKPVDLAVLQSMIKKSIEDQRARRRQSAGDTRKSRYKRDPFLGTSAAMSGFATEVRKILGTESTILIQGETGTGKGVLAEWLHQNGPRKEEPFVDLNCAGLSRELLESELFGHEKGAFTGAVATKTGLMEMAHHGTVFLDEIGDMDPVIQPKLLKVLEDKRFRRLGEVRDRNIDVQLIAATHQNLPRLVAESKFRSDLFFRISTIPLRIPALRERAADIPVIADHFVRQLQADLGRLNLSLAPDAIQALQRYAWPGNIRELRNVLERAALLCDEGLIKADDLRFQIETGLMPSADRAVDLTLEELEKQHIQTILQIEKGSVAKAALRLGIPRSTLYAKIRYFSLTSLDREPET